MPGGGTFDARELAALEILQRLRVVDVVVPLHPLLEDWDAARFGTVGGVPVAERGEEAVACGDPVVRARLAPVGSFGRPGDPAVPEPRRARPELLAELACRHVL